MSMDISSHCIFANHSWRCFSIILACGCLWLVRGAFDLENLNSMEQSLMVLEQFLDRCTLFLEHFLIVLFLTHFPVQRTSFGNMHHGHRQCLPMPSIFSPKHQSCGGQFCWLQQVLQLPLLLLLLSTAHRPSASQSTPQAICDEQKNADILRIGVWSGTVQPRWADAPTNSLIQLNKNMIT
jgi:hypothetical protein